MSESNEPAERTPDATPEIIAVMCEPVRWRAYGLLHGLGPLRGVQLAKRVSVSEASMLKHLELMESIGFVRSDPESAKTPRHRTWRAIPGSLRLSGMEDKGDPEAMRQWMQVFALAHNLVLRQWAQEEDSWPIEWRTSALNYDYWMHLTQEELEQMGKEIHAVTQRWDALSRERGRVDGGEPIYVSTNAFPIRA